MKLIKCYVENFGKLSNFTYNFKDGLNIIKEQNGFGKTTFAVFIKSMFYGMDAGKNTKIEKSERKKYYPWQGGNYGGNIEFEVDGNKYKIERFFGKKPAEDTFKLYDLATNLESKDFTENIGEEIFKINKEGYERSTYIPQGQIQIEMEDSINAKLGNVLESDNDVNSSEQAIIAINNAKKLYKKERGKGGLIDEKKEKLNQLERELEKRQSDFEILKIQEEKLNKLNNNIKEQGKLRDQSQQMLSEKMEQGRKVAKLETYKTILTKYNKSQENIDELTEFFANDIPSDDLIKNLTEKNFELEITKNQLKNNKFSVEDQEKVTLILQNQKNRPIENSIDYFMDNLQTSISLSTLEKDYCNFVLSGYTKTCQDRGKIDKLYEQYDMTHDLGEKEKILTKINNEKNKPTTDEIRKVVGTNTITNPMLKDGDVNKLLKQAKKSLKEKIELFDRELFY